MLTEHIVETLGHPRVNRSDRRNTLPKYTIKPAWQHANSSFKKPHQNCYLSSVPKAKCHENPQNENDHRGKTPRLFKPLRSATDTIDPRPLIPHPTRNGSSKRLHHHLHRPSLRASRRPRRRRATRRDGHSAQDMREPRPLHQLSRRPRERLPQGLNSRSDGVYGAEMRGDGSRCGDNTFEL